jgi:prefoldin subunit 5
MTDAQIQDIYSRLDNLTTEVNSLKTQIGVVGTTQYAVVQILDRLERVEATQNQHTEMLNSHTEMLNTHTQLLNTHTQLLNQILRILRDRNGGSGI